MKLANIYTSVDGMEKGQAAVGNTDTDCLDLKAAESGGLCREIVQVVRTDSLAQPTVISRKLQSTAGQKYISLTDRNGYISVPSNLYGFYNVEGVGGFKMSADIVISNVSAICQMFEMYLSASTLVRCGLEPYSGHTGLAMYLASRYNSSSSSEINSSGNASGFLQLNVPYRIVYGLSDDGSAYIQAFTLDAQGTAEQLFYITGARQRCYGSGGGTRVFNSYALSGRGFVGKVSSFTLEGFGPNGSTRNCATYKIDDSTVGGTTLRASEVTGSPADLTSPALVQQDTTLVWAE